MSRAYPAGLAPCEAVGNVRPGYFSSESKPRRTDEHGAPGDGRRRDDVERRDAARGWGGGPASVGAGVDERSEGGYRARWEGIQSRFVDDPRSSVEQADKLVIEVVQDLQTTFGSERHALEEQWQRGDDIQTEDLRVALQRYRTFFDRLLAA
jgi:hypothetical protein